MINENEMNAYVLCHGCQVSFHEDALHGNLCVSCRDNMVFVVVYQWSTVFEDGTVSSYIENGIMAFKNKEDAIRQVKAINNGEENTGVTFDDEDTIEFGVKKFNAWYQFSYYYTRK